MPKGASSSIPKGGSGGFPDFISPLNTPPQSGDIVPPIKQDKGSMPADPSGIVPGGGSSGY